MKEFLIEKEINFNEEEMESRKKNSKYQMDLQ